MLLGALEGKAISGGPDAERIKQVMLILRLTHEK
jgi:hypothetical protein